MYGTCVFRICILPYLCVMQYFHVIHVERSSYMSTAKLATFESQKEVVCTTHLWNLKKERLRHRNQRNRDRRAAESAQQRRVFGLQERVFSVRDSRPEYESSRVGTSLSAIDIKKGLTPYSIADRIWSHSCMYSANIHYRHLTRQHRDVKKLESQETSGIYVFIRTKILKPHPTLQATSKSLEIL